MISKRVRVESFVYDRDNLCGDGIGDLTLLLDPADPLAVQMDLGDGNVWSFSRNLLPQGLQYPAGMGDVRIEPYNTRIAVTLQSHMGRALLLLNRRAVDEFAQLIRDIKDDTPDIDGLIEQIQKWGSR